MQPDDYTRWLEVLGGALAALGAWIWRVAAKMQSYDERLNALQVALKAELAKRGERDAKIFAKLEDLRVNQAAQSAELKHIASTCAGQAAILEILADRVPGGRRQHDPPERT